MDDELPARRGDASVPPSNSTLEELLQTDHWEEQKNHQKRQTIEELKKVNPWNDHVTAAVQLKVSSETKDWKWAQSILPPVKEEPVLIAAPPLHHGGQDGL